MNRVESMVRIGYHASHEQFTPGALLAHVQEAEAAGFHVAMCSDHFAPWSVRQNQSGFAWAWLGAALQATALRMGVVNAPGQRYHPAIIAQACATLSEMFPDRFWIAVGSGEALNEHITGEAWPVKTRRNERLRECVDVMRALWAGETVSHEGLVQVHEAKLYTLPASPIPVIGAALTPETARWLAGWADGLITVNQPENRHREVLRAFREGGGEGKPCYLQVHIAWAGSEAEARQHAYEQWRTNVFASTIASDLYAVEQFDAIAEFVRPGDLDEHVRISTDPGQHAEWIRGDAEAGFEEIYLHNVGRNQQAFIETFGAKVIGEVVG